MTPDNTPSTPEEEAALAAKERARAQPTPLGSMNTPADKPDLPAIPAWAAAIMTSHERQTLRAHIQRQIDAARADERRKVLEEAEALLRQRLDAAKHTHAISEGPYSEGMRDAYDVAVLDIQSMIDRKEPTT